MYYMTFNFPCPLSIPFQILPFQFLLSLCELSMCTYMNKISWVCSYWSYVMV